MYGVIFLHPSSLLQIEFLFSFWATNILFATYIARCVKHSTLRWIQLGGLAVFLLLSLKFLGIGFLQSVPETFFIGIAFIISYITILNGREELEVNDFIHHTSSKKKVFLQTGSALFIISIFVYFGVQHLGQFLTVDEPKWLYNRVPQLVESITDGNWEGTYINDKPGLVPSLLSAPIFFLAGLSRGLDPATFETYLFLWRIPLVLFNAGLLYLFYRTIKQGWGGTIAILTLVFTALNPLLIGISQIVNPDATLWSTSMLVWVFFFRYIHTNQKKYLIWSGFWMILALLSKFFVTMFFVYFFGVIILEYFWKKNHSWGNLQQRLYDFTWYILITTGIFGLLWPATWNNTFHMWWGSIGSGLYDPLQPVVSVVGAVWMLIEVTKSHNLLHVLKKYIPWTQVVVITIHVVLAMAGAYLIYYFMLDKSSFDFSEFMMTFQRGEGGQYISILKANIIISFFVIPFPQIILLVLLILIPIFQRSFDTSFKYTYLTLGFCIFFVISTGAGGFIADARYQIMLYPLLAIANAITLYMLLTLIKWRKLAWMSCFVFIGYNLSILLQSPFHFQFTNVFNTDNLVITDAWGAGGYEVAQYLNEFPNPENISVWVDREGVDEFFKGKTKGRSSINEIIQTSTYPDYVSITWGGERIFRRGSLEYTSGNITEFTEMAHQVFPVYKSIRQIPPVYEICLRGNEQNCVSLYKGKDFFSGISKGYDL